VGESWLLGVTWLVVGGAVLCLFVARLWSSLPPDPEFRRRLAGWLVLLAVAAALISVWSFRSNRERRSSFLQPPSTTAPAR